MRDKEKQRIYNQIYYHINRDHICKLHKKRYIKNRKHILEQIRKNHQQKIDDLKEYIKERIW